jgi:GntR family transcriptional repressor for pyruvate dehydrogenase complex
MARRRDMLMRLAEIRPSDRTPVPRNVSASLRAMILSGDLQPGDRLPSQRDLAERLRISRPSVREALAELETLGLITIRVGSGVYVADPEARAPLWRFSDRCTPREVYEVRFGLEGYAAALAAGRIDQAGAKRLGDSVDALRVACEKDDIDTMAQADAQFHDLVFELTGNPVLAGMYRPVRDLMVETQRLPMRSRTGLADTVKEHVAVKARIAAGDVAGAQRAMQEHIRAAAARFDLELAGAPFDASG